MARDNSTNKQSRTGLILLTLCYLIFVIYGSLVPLHYRPLPLDEALWRFGGISFLDLGIGSRADWVANVLLFIPLGFLWLGIVWPQQRGVARFLVSLLVMAAATSLSIGIEFTQLYFPPRTVSQNDILAETLGALIGIILWWRYGTGIHQWVMQTLRTKGKSNLAEKLLWLYLMGVFLYNVLPLDLTISPVEIYHKWRDGKVNLIPFGFFVADPAQRIYDLVTDALLWTPVSLLWVVSRKRAGMQAWAWTVLAAILLEFFQLFVYSRVTDVTDIAMAMAGAGLGVWLSRFISGIEQASVPRSSGLRRPAWTLVMCLCWIWVLLVIFWYPFDFQLDRTFLRERLQLFQRAPFHAYYYGTEFRAVTELLHKIIFFIPAGAILAFGRLRMPRSAARSAYGILAIGILIAMPLGIELGQVALPHKSPGATDLILEIVGGLIGYCGLLFLNHRAKSNPLPD